MDIGLEPEPVEERSKSSETEDLKSRQEVFINHIRKSNLTLAAALEKAVRWQWTDENLLLVFGSTYEAALIKNEADFLRRSAVEAGFQSIVINAKTENIKEGPDSEEESPRVTLVRQVFRGQVTKDKT